MSEGQFNQVPESDASGQGMHWATLTPAAIGAVPAAQAFTLANNTYQTLQSWTVAGQADDPLPAFALVTGSQTYGSSPAIQGPAYWYGYNAALLSGSVSSSPHGAAGLSCFADAGDSNNGAGGHGLEMNPASFRTPDGTKSTNAFQMVAIDDNTNTVNTTIRCGTGSVNGITSNITLCNSGSSTTFMIMGGAVSGNITAYRPLTAAYDMNALPLPGVTVKNTNASAGSATFQIDVNNNAGLAQVVFANAGVNKWAVGYSAALANWIYIEDYANSRFPFRIAPGASAVATQVTVDGQASFTNSVIVNNGGTVLATTATDGFLYLPTCAGVPTGVPAAKAGSAAHVYDTADNKLYVYNGGWKSVTLS